MTNAAWTNSVGTDPDELNEEHGALDFGTKAFSFSWNVATCPEGIVKQFSALLPS